MKKYLAALAVVLLVAGAAGGWWAFARNRDQLAQARDYLAKNDLAGATVALRSAVRNNPDNAEAHAQLAMLQLRQGDAVAAERELKSARQLGADPAQLDPALAQAYAAQGKYKEIVDEFLPDRVPPARRPATLVTRGLAQLALNDVPAATASITEAEKLAPNSPEPPLAAARLAISQRDFAGAEQKVDRTLALEPKRQDALQLKAQLLAAKGDRAGALVRLDSAIDVAPRNVGARLQRAELLIAAGQDDKARADVDAAMQLQNRNVLAVFYNAVLLTRARKFKEADAELTRVNTVITRLPRGLYYLAVVKASLGDAEQAIDAATRYYARAPEDPQGRKLLAQVLLAGQQPDKAIEVLTDAQKAGKADADIDDLLGRAYAIKGRPDEAARSFEAAASLAPQNTDVLARLAASRLASGDAAGATGALERSLEVSPGQTQTTEQLVVAALASGDIPRATAALNDLRKQAGETETVGNLTGLLKLAQADVDGARAQFADVVQKFPDSSAARLNLGRTLLLLGRPAEAEPMFTAVLAKDPANAQALGTLINVYVQTNRVPQAVGLMQAANLAKPNDPGLQAALADLLVRGGDPNKALASLDEATRGVVSPSVAIQAARARAQAAAGQTADARSGYEAILRANPADLEARRQFIELLAGTNDYTGAEAVVRDGLKVTPGSSPLLETLLRIEFKANGVNGAVNMADQLRREPVNLPAALKLKGDAYMLAQRPADAVTAYTAEYKAAPSSELAQRIANAMIVTGKPDDGAQVLRGWVKDHPDDDAVLRMLGSMDIAAHRLPDAEQHLSAAVAKQPNDAVALNNLAWIYQQKNDSRAKPTALQAYTRSPNADTADTLGWILAQGGDPQGGLGLLQQSNNLRPGNKTVQYHLAVALRDTGKSQEAIAMLQPIFNDPAPFDEKADAKRVLDGLMQH